MLQLLNNASEIGECSKEVRQCVYLQTGSFFCRKAVKDGCSSLCWICFHASSHVCYLAPSSVSYLKEFKFGCFFCGI